MNALHAANDTQVADLRQLIDSARHRAAVTVIAELTLLYWKVGDRIHHDILARQRAEYGEETVSALGRQLSANYPTKNAITGCSTC